MSRTALLGTLALALLLAAGVASYLADEGGWLPTLLAVAALGVVVTAVATGGAEISRIARARQTRRGALALASSALVLIALAIVGFLAERHVARIDLTERRIHTLSRDTHRVLESIPAGTTVELYAIGGIDTPFDPQQWKMLSLIDESSPRVRLVPVVAEREPTLARELGATRYPAVVVRFRPEDEEEPRQRTTSLIEEQAVARTIEQALLGELPVLRVVQGHGEMRPEDGRALGLGAAAADIAADNFRIEMHSLKDPVPDGTAVLLIPGPETDLLPGERETLDAWLEGGGRLLLLFGPPMTGGPQENWHAWLESWGIEARRDLVADLDGLLAGADVATLLVEPTGTHPIVDGASRRLVVPVARSVRRADIAPDRTTIEILLRSDESSWAETTLEGGQPRYDADADEKGPVPIAVAVERRIRGARGEVIARPRLVVVGSSRFAANVAYQQQGNPDFLLSSLAWLVEREAVLEERRRGVERDGTVVVADSQFRLILVATLLVPLVVAAAGAAQWAWRRRL